MSLTVEQMIELVTAQLPEEDGANNGRLSAGLLPHAVLPREVPPEADLDHPALYFNQELGWLDFNWRVLHLAMDERTPLLERVRFIAITASNLDEFFQKRVGGLKRQEAAGVSKLTADGRMPGRQLTLIHRSASLMHRTMTNVWERQLKPALEQEAQIFICHYEQLTEEEKDQLRHYFMGQLYPILTPLTVDPGHPFPFISNLSLSLAAMLRHPQYQTTHFARVKVPTNLGRWLPLHDILFQPDDDQRLRFLPVEQLIGVFAAALFPGMEIVTIHPFRVTRNAAVGRDEEEAEDLLAMISEELRERQFAPVVRVEVAQQMPDYERQYLMRELNLEEEALYEAPGLLDLSACHALANLDRPTLKYPSWEPIIPRRLRFGGGDKKDIFSIIRQGDVLVHHPYESFAASVQRLIEEAAVDPDVLAIKLTLYRTSDKSPIVKALIRAAEHGKQVAVLVEVKARFDEANNIEWGQMLEDAGVHVAYGLVGLKTHTKATLIIRREAGGLQIYSHIGTGNYHPKTARLYTDLGLLTANPVLGYDLVKLFHYLTGYAPGQEYEKVLVAPSTMRDRFNQLIEREIAVHQEQGNGRIIAKMNGLDDEKMIRKLYQASQAGVQIDLIIRGHSRLRPGVPGFSDNIRVISILGRFLEHDRIFYFHHNGQPQVFIGSADWRGRNLNSRVELIAPIEEPALQQRLIDILEEALRDNRSSWELDSEGQYRLRRPAADEKTYFFHERLMKKARKRKKKKA